MKSFSLFKLPVLLVGLGAALVLSPACKAQSEVAPDHFDGTDSWAVKPQKPAAAKFQHQAAVLPSRNLSSDSRAKLQLSSARQVTRPAQRSTAAVSDNRKAVARKPKKK